MNRAEILENTLQAKFVVEQELKRKFTDISNFLINLPYIDWVHTEEWEDGLCEIDLTTAGSNVRISVTYDTQFIVRGQLGNVNMDAIMSDLIFYLGGADDNEENYEEIGQDNNNI